MSGKLYIVPTPVGNLGDMTPRAVELFDQSEIDGRLVTVTLLCMFPSSLCPMPSRKSILRINLRFTFFSFCT